MRRTAGILAFLAIATRPLGPGAQPAAAVAPLRTAASADIAAGKRIFESQCAWCHGTNGTGGTGPDLRRATLRHAANDKTLVDIVRNGIPGTEMPSFAIALTDRAAWQTAAYVQSLGRVAARVLPGDRRKGEAVYESAGCATCHIVDGRGRALGPELTAIGALRGASHLRDSIVNPAATHPPGYLVVRAVTTGGREIRGIRLNEDVFWIHVRDAGGNVHVLQKSELSTLDRELEATLMPSYASRLSEAELDDLIAYLANLRGPMGRGGQGGRGGLRGQGGLGGPEGRGGQVGRVVLVGQAGQVGQVGRVGQVGDAPSQVSPTRPEQAAEQGEWRTYSGSYQSHRFSPLTQISTGNVGRLRPLWVYQPPGVGSLEGTPVVADGVMYVTSAPANVVALDLRSGRPLWEWSRPIPASVLNLGFPRVNRGVAILGDSVYVGTLDGYLVSLDARSGTQRWAVQAGENPMGHAITAAPLAVEDKIIVGISGGEAGIRGYLDAYDAKTGKLAWRFWTIPSPGEPGSESWPGDSWVHGAGATWLTGSYDPALKLIYWGTGNPGPDWNGDSRKGDNLYTCSIVAIDAETGKLRWYFQFTPHDVHDWDANQIPVLVDLEIGGRSRQLVAMANRNGFFYVLDRRTGEFIRGAPYAKQTWARGLDERGRPILIPDMEPSEKGTLVYPSLQGSTNWGSPAYSPATGMMYVPVREMGSVYYKSSVEYRPGTYYTGGSEKRLDEESWGAVRALDVATGRALWDFKLPTPPWAGVMATAGGLVFGGSNEGNFYALDANTGKPLWQFQTGGPIRCGPMSFLSEGKQRVVIAGGHAIYAFGIE